jgi:hypothetical protein
MKDFRTATGILLVIGLWYGVGYLHGYATGYSDCTKVTEWKGKQTPTLDGE